MNTDNLFLNVQETATVAAVEPRSVYRAIEEKFFPDDLVQDNRVHLLGAGLIRFYFGYDRQLQASMRRTIIDKAVEMFRADRSLRNYLVHHHQLLDVLKHEREVHMVVDAFDTWRDVDLTWRSISTYNTFRIFGALEFKPVNHFLSKISACDWLDDGLFVPITPSVLKTFATYTDLQKVREFVSQDPEVLSGTPVFKGTRLPVHVVVANLANGMTPEQVHEAFPSASIEQIRLAPLYAKAYPARGPKRRFAGLPENAKPKQSWIVPYRNPPTKAQ